ncbi:MAG: GDCCVxC domain-containing (seleno)protein [Pseudomonadota bacterium]
MSPDWGCQRPSEGLMGLLQAEITCPLCGHREVIQVPAAACQIRHDCTACGAVLSPRPGDCCVSCSYGADTPDGVKRSLVANDTGCGCR